MLLAETYGIDDSCLKYLASGGVFQTILNEPFDPFAKLVCQVDTIFIEFDIRLYLDKSAEDSRPANRSGESKELF
jgi:hypothetical protein